MPTNKTDTLPFDKKKKKKIAAASDTAGVGGTGGLADAKQNNGGEWATFDWEKVSLAFICSFL